MGVIEEVKTAVVIINVGNMPYADLSIQANQRYYDHLGIELRVLTKHHPETVNTSPCWIKSLIYEIYDDLDFILLQDLDILPVDSRYNIFDFLMVDQLNFATDYTRVGHKISESPFPFFRWNCGLFGYPKRFKETFRRIFNFGLPDPHGDKLYDQYYINEYIGKNDLYVNEIPIRFNTFFHEDICYNKISFCHYTNTISTSQKRETILRRHPQNMFI